mgnify:FL=1
MRSELEAFLYELAGNVEREKRADELSYLEQELAAIRARPTRIRVPLLFNLAANLFHNARLGLKVPMEKSVFDLDVEKIFADHAKTVKEWDDVAKLRKEIEQP